MLLLRRFMYLILVAFTAIAIEVRYLSAQGDWILWIALSLSLTMQGTKLSTRLLVTSVTGLLIALLSVITTTLALYQPLLIIYLIALIFLGTSIAQQKQQYNYPILIIIFFILISALSPITIIGSLNRSCDILIGTLIAAIYQLIFLPWFNKSEMDASIQLLLKKLLHLTDDIFACFLQPSYTDNTYLFERRIHIQKKKIITILQYARKLDVEKQKYTMILNTLEKIFESLLACALLRMRVTDPTIFAVCTQEMSYVHEELRSNIMEMMKIYKHKNPYMNTQGLEDRIERFENNYQTVLQVTAREPLVFLIFISSLKAIKDEIDDFERLLTAKQN